MVPRPTSSTDILANLSTDKAEAKISNLSTEVNEDVSECEKFYKLIINESPLYPGDCNIPIVPKDIPWVEPKLLEKGRQFVRVNYAAIVVCNIISFLCDFSIKSACLVLLKSQKFHKQNYPSFLKVLSTANRVLVWYEDDILSENSNSYKNIEVTRIMHLAVAKWKGKNKESPSIEEMEISVENDLLMKAMKKDLEFVDTSQAPLHLITWTPQVEFSQFDNVIFLWSLVAWPQILAKSVGISDFTLFEGYQHMWAVIGRLLGIEDRFNVALHYSEEISQKLFTNIIVASLKETDLTVTVSQRTYMGAFSKMTAILRIKPVLYLFLKGALPEFKGDNLYALMTLTDKICYNILVAIAELIFRYDLARLLANDIIRRFVDYNVGKHIPKFRKNYPVPNH